MYGLPHAGIITQELLEKISMKSDTDKAPLLPVSRAPIYDHWNTKIISQHANRTQQVYENETQRPAIRFCQTLQSSSKGQLRRLRLHRNLQGNVWSTACRHYNPRASRKKYQWKGIQTKHPYSQSLDTCLATNIIHTMRGWFFRKIYRQRTCLPPPQNAPWELHRLHKLGKEMIPRHEFILGLRKLWYTRVYAGVCHRSAQMFQTHFSAQNATPTAPTCLTPTYGAKLQYVTKANSSPLQGK